MITSTVLADCESVTRTQKAQLEKPEDRHGYCDCDGLTWPEVGHASSSNSSYNTHKRNFKFKGKPLKRTAVPITGTD